MGRATVQTVTGAITTEDLGTTLAHEHLLIGWPGWDSDTIRPGASRSEVLTICEDRVAQVQAHGLRTMIDPCPNDLGRDVELMAEVSARTGLQIICATGLYKEDQGGAPYWKFRAQFGGTVESIAELYVRELTVGIGQTGIRAGIIKVATGAPSISEYERMLLEAAAIASNETGAPITTHTESGCCGDEQQRILTEFGVPAHRIIVGHSCGSSDHDYHMRILQGGSYLGFDRFGLEILQPDEVRCDSLLKLIKAGRASQIVVSHDTVWCWRGAAIPDPEIAAPLLEVWTPCHFFERIVPRLKEGGATEGDIRSFVEENPRRFFDGALPPHR